MRPAYAFFAYDQQDSNVEENRFLVLLARSLLADKEMAYRRSRVVREPLARDERGKQWRKRKCFGSLELCTCTV